MNTALVLSAGGMFGAYQAGAWRVLAETWQPDLIIGASVGALNGWAIAGGCPAEELVRNWLQGEWAGVVRRHPRWKLVYDPKPLEQRCRELFSEFQPRVPFGVALTAVPGLKRVLARHEEIEWRHLLATCSIPCAYPPVRIGGRWYVDGGFLGALPLWAAAEMGAARVIAINVLPRMPSWWVRTIVRAARAFARLKEPPPPPAIQIAPAQPLGSLDDMLWWKAANVRRWIEQGERDARQYAAQVQGMSLADRIKRR